MIRLKEAMQLNPDISVRDIAEKCRFKNVQTVYNIINGRTTRLEPATIKCLCDLLHVDANFLLGIDIEDTEMAIKPHWEKIVIDGAPVGENMVISFNGEKFWMQIGETPGQFRYRVKSEIRRKFKKNINIL